MTSKTKRPRPHQNMVVEIESMGGNIFVIVDGVEIAKRGDPHGTHAKTWVSLEPGWEVRSVNSPEGLEINYQGTRVHLI
jgi:hypothetical protein